MKKIKILFSSFLALFLCLFSMSAVAGAKGPLKENASTNGGEGKHVVAYFADWDTYSGYNVSDIPVKDLTDINYAFANIDSNTGKIVLGDPWADVQKPFPGDSDSEAIKGNIGQLIKLKQTHPNLKTIISVGGWSWSSQFSKVASTPQSRATFAASVVDFLRTYRFDGIDLDWEYPVSGGMTTGVPADKQNYTLLLKEIRSQLDQSGGQDHKHYILTIAGGASKYFVNHTELDKIANLVDWINLMGYDYHGTWEATSGFNAPLANDPAGLDDRDAVNAYLKAGVPSEKIVLGMPLYGHSWSGCAAGATHGEFQQCTGSGIDGGSPTYKDLVANYINKNGFVRYWDHNLEEPWLYNAQTGDFISYEDVASISFKTRFIKSHELGGGMVWELSNDYNNQLMNTIGNDLLSRN